MAFKLSKFEIGMIVAFVVTTGAGIGGYFYTDGLVQASKTELTTAGGKLQELVKSRYFPSQENIKILDSNVKELQDAITPVEDKVLKSGSEKLGAIEAKNPVTWKNNDLDSTVRKLGDAARSKKVQLPQDYYFGFSRYQRSNPSEQATLVLGKQLFGIEQLATTLFDSSSGGAIESLKGIRRSSEEEGVGGGEPTAETFKAPIHTSANGLYRIYPFDMEFTGTPAGLRNFLNALQQSPILFIVRSVQIVNSKLDSPKIGDLGKSATGDTRAASAVGRDFVFGGEKLQVRVRVDMIEWLGAKKAEAAAATKRPPQPVK